MYIPAIYVFTAVFVERCDVKEEDGRNRANISNHNSLPEMFREKLREPPIEALSDHVESEKKVRILTARLRKVLIVGAMVLFLGLPAFILQRCVIRCILQKWWETVTKR